MFQKFQHTPWSLDARKRRSFLRGQNLTTVSSHPHLERQQHLTTRIQVPSRTHTVYSSMSLHRSSRWNMITKCRSCSVISSKVCNAKTRRQYGFFPLTVSCFLPVSVEYTVTCYTVFSPRQQQIYLSARHIQPSTIISLSLGYFIFLS